jgi:hypothetical protein
MEHRRSWPISDRGDRKTHVVVATTIFDGEVVYETK